MAIFTTGVFGFDVTTEYDFIDPNSAALLSTSSTEIVITVQGTDPNTGDPTTFFLTIEGTKLPATVDSPASGTITAIRFTLGSQNGTPLYEVTELKTSFKKWLNAPTDEAANNLLFGKNDTFLGSDQDDALAGFNGNDVLDGGAGQDLLIGGSGNDTYIVDNFNDFIFEEAKGGTDTVLSSVSFLLDPFVEHLTLTGSANIDALGNELNNTLTGNDGNNRLDGGAGTDTMIGGLGDDTYVVDNVKDRVTENAGEGTDTVETSFSLVLGRNLENLTLTGSEDLTGTGNELNNTILGNAGANLLDGKAGADAMSGGAGDDTYIVDDAGDTVTEGAGEGTDTVETSFDFTLGANVENLTLTGKAAIDGTGNDLDNVLTGNAGANVLTGGAGDDTYVIQNPDDVIVELAGGGNDTVVTTSSFTLGGNIENLTLAGKAANGTGDAQDNVLIGNARSNILDGGAGADTMQGDAGNDTYIVDDVGDTVTEVAGKKGGRDTVVSSVSFTLGDFIENLTLTGGDDIDGTGNALNNILIGNDGSNRLDGGAGTDTMTGKGGDDTYVVDNVKDRVIEAAGEGTDTVESAISFTLGRNLENLTLTGSEDLTGTGNELNNTILGNAGANLLDGKAGADRMEGDAGDDIYIVDDAGDIIVENPDDLGDPTTTDDDFIGGDDTVQSSVTFALGANVENLILAGKTAIDGTGNELDNILIGNGGANVLIGNGGADSLNGDAGNDTLSGGAGADTLDGGKGADNMAGGVGDDTYAVDNAGDVVEELAGEGTDTVESSINFTLGANVENLTLTGKAASGTGNDLDNILTGTTRKNTLTGGEGDDTYVVLNSKDVIVELAGEGNDTVESTVRFELGDNIENLTLTGSRGVDGTGNELDNVLTGNNGSNDLFGGLGNDTLDGGAGGVDNLFGEEGNDILNGNAGANSLFGGIGDDTFVFEEVESFTTIEDFEQGSDIIDMTALGFDNFADFEAQADIFTTTDGDAFISYVAPDSGPQIVIVVAGVDSASLTPDDFLF